MLSQNSSTVSSAKDNLDYYIWSLDKRKKHSCLVSGCKTNSIDNPEKLFVPVPLDRYTKALWLQLAAAQPKTTPVLENRWFFCEEHFEGSKDIETYQELVVGNMKTMHKMLKDCQPRLKLPCKLSEILPLNLEEEEKLSVIKAPVKTYCKKKAVTSQDNVNININNKLNAKTTSQNEQFSSNDDIKRIMSKLGKDIQIVKRKRTTQESPKECLINKNDNEVCKKVKKTDQVIVIDDFGEAETENRNATIIEDPPKEMKRELVGIELKPTEDIIDVEFELSKDIKPKLEKGIYPINVVKPEFQISTHPLNDIKPKLEAGANTINEIEAIQNDITKSMPDPKIKSEDSKNIVTRTTGANTVNENEAIQNDCTKSLPDLKTKSEASKNIVNRTSRKKTTEVPETINDTINRTSKMKKTEVSKTTNDSINRTSKRKKTEVPTSTNDASKVPITHDKLTPIKLENTNTINRNSKRKKTEVPNTINDASKAPITHDKLAPIKLENTNTINRNSKRTKTEVPNTINDASKAPITHDKLTPIKLENTNTINRTSKRKITEVPNTINDASKVPITHDKLTPIKLENTNTINRTSKRKKTEAPNTINDASKAPITHDKLTPIKLENTNTINRTSKRKKTEVPNTINDIPNTHDKLAPIKLENTSTTRSKSKANSALKSTRISPRTNSRTRRNKKKPTCICCADACSECIPNSPVEQITRSPKKVQIPRTRSPKKAKKSSKKGLKSKNIQHRKKTPDLNVLGPKTIGIIKNKSNTKRRYNRRRKQISLLNKNDLIENEDCAFNIVPENAFKFQDDPLADESHLDDIRALGKLFGERNDSELQPTIVPSSGMSHAEFTLSRVMLASSSNINTFTSENDGLNRKRKASKKKGSKSSVPKIATCIYVATTQCNKPYRY